MLLNTNWAEAGNIRKVTVNTPKYSFQTEVKEREAKILTAVGDVIIDAPQQVHVEVTDNAVYLHGSGVREIKIHGKNRYETRRITFTTTCQQLDI